MPSIFATFNSLRRAMETQQYSLNVTSHNISNANTEGYSRQRAIMETSRPEGVSSLNSASGPGQLGTGVEIREVTRARDMFLDMQIRNELSTSGRFAARDEFLSEIEIIFMEPSENGLSTSMGEMWDSWQTLSKNPETSNSRTGVVEAALTFTDALNHTYDQLEKLEGHSDSLVKGQIFEFNNLLEQVQDLNRQIKGIRMTGNNPNDLLDKQDLIIDKLSEMADIRVDRGPLGEAIITTGTTVVTGEDKQNLSFIKAFEKRPDGLYTMTYFDKGDTSSLKMRTISPDQYMRLRDAKMLWTDDVGNYERADIGNGSIKGYSSISREIGEYKNQLDAMARALAVAVNTVHNDGRIPKDYTGNDIAFFVASDAPDDESAITAKNITVNRELEADPSKIHARANYNEINPDDNDPIGNGDRALAISQLRDSRIFMNEFLDDRSMVVSGVVAANENTPLAFSTDGDITIKTNGVDGTIHVSAGDSLKDIAARINALDMGKTVDSTKLYVRASVDNGRLIIQSLKSEDNSVAISDNKYGEVLEGLKIYDRDDPAYWSYMRENNTIIGSYDSSAMRFADDPKGTSVSGYFKDTVAKLGSSAKQAKDMVVSQDALVGQLLTRKESISGVSIDEEMANLVQFQHAYNAAAKAVSVMDELLNTLINGLIR